MTRRHDVAPGKDPWPKSMLPVDHEIGGGPDPGSPESFMDREVVMLEKGWPGLPKGTIGKVIGISPNGWLEIDWGFPVAFNSSCGWPPTEGRFMVLGKPGDDPKRVSRVKPQPLMLAWVGGGYGLRPRLLGTVPEGTKAKDVDADHAIVGTLDEFLSAYLNPGSDD